MEPLVRQVFQAPLSPQRTAANCSDPGYAAGRDAIVAHSRRACGHPYQRTPTAAAWTVSSTKWHAELDDRNAALMHLRDELAGSMGCGCLSTLDCPLPRCS